MDRQSRPWHHLNICKACAARMTSSNSTGHCSAMCKVGEDYRLADYYYIKSYCFGTMEGKRRDLCWELGRIIPKSIFNWFQISQSIMRRWFVDPSYIKTVYKWDGYHWLNCPKKDWDTNEHTGELIPDQEPVSLVRFKLYPYVLFGCAVVGIFHKIFLTSLAEIVLET